MNPRMYPAENANNDFEELQYFYHPDHASTSLSTSLGSANIITDDSANAVQHMLYLPFGEQFVSEGTGDFDSRYKFSGKELDDETGYNYFGARYYDSDLSKWLSVDPMSDSRPNLSPYNYCQWNPVGRIDPDGANDDNYDIYENGDIKVERTNDKTNTYTYHKNDGATVDLGTYDVVNNDGKDMVKISSSGTAYSKALTNSENYLPEDAAAGFLGASYSYYSENDYKTKINQFLSVDYKHSGSKVSKPCIDVQYVGAEGTSWETQPITTNKNVDVDKSLKLAKNFIKFGWGDKTKWSVLTESAAGKSLFNDYTTVPGHKNHMHIQGFDKNKVQEIIK